MRIWRRLSVAGKLNMILAVALLLAIGGSALVTSHLARKEIEAKSLDELRKINQLVSTLLGSYNDAQRSSAERMRQVFASQHEGTYTLRTTPGGEPELLRNGVPQNGNFESVDRFARNVGVVSTLFVRTGDDFKRVATSLKKEDGTRAVGTMLGDKHPAHAALLRGDSYTGPARLFGRDYMASYYPLRDATGRVVGAAFVGLDFTDSLKALKAQILALKVGTTGYVYAFDSGSNPGMLTIHPAKEGSSLIDAKDANGNFFVRDMLAKGSGVIHYDWKNPGEP